MPNKILAILEQRDGMIKRSGFEAASVAFNLSKDLNISAEAGVVGDSISNIDEVSRYGIQKVYHLKSSSLSNYSSSGYSEAITNMAKEFAYDILILPNTTLGKDLAPRISIQLDAACLDLIANLVFSLAITVLIFGVLAVLYGFMYKFFGPPEYGPTDAPPVKGRKVKRYKR